MKRSAVVFLTAVMVCAVSIPAIAQTPYSQDFEALAPVDGSLAADGWLNYGNVFDPSWNYIYGYGPFPAVNNIGNWQDITNGQGGVPQGVQQLVVYSDYANGNHGSGNWVESNCYQEQVVPAGATGMWCFTFDAKHGDLGGSSTALAFIKTLDPNNGYALTNFITYDTTLLPTTWGTFTISIDVAGLDGQILQFGFSSMATNYEPCGMIYDNVIFGPCASPVEEATWGAVKALYR